MGKDKKWSKKKRVGVVVSEKMDKSVTIQVQRLVKHKLYDRYIRRHSKLMAHDENNQFHVGDKVLMVESRPISKHKRWRVVKKLEEATAA